MLEKNSHSFSPLGALCRVSGRGRAPEIAFDCEHRGDPMKSKKSKIFKILVFGAINPLIATQYLQAQSQGVKHKNFHKYPGSLKVYKSANTALHYTTRCSIHYTAYFQCINLQIFYPKSALKMIESPVFW